MKQIVKINLIIFGLALAGFSLTKLGLPFLQYISGLLLYFVLGLDFALILEKVCRDSFGSLKIILWSFFFSLTLLPAIFYVFYLVRGFATLNSAAFFALVLQIVLLVVLVLIDKLSEAQTTNFNLKNIFKDRLFWTLAGLFLLAISVNFFLYKFNPAADPYSYLINLNKYLVGGTIGLTEERPIFIIFLQSLSALTRIDPYWILKVILPLFSFPLLLLFYHLAKKTLSNKFLLALSASSFLLFPIILAEILIGRPQLFFLITFPIALYLVSEIIQEKLNYKIYGILIILLLQAAALKIHPFFFFGVFLTLIGLIYYLRTFIKKHLFESALALIFVAVSLYPWLQTLGLIGQFANFAGIFKTYLLHPHFHFWFLSGATEIDGVQLSWPGYLALFYYGYNLGLLLPISILFLIFRKKKLVLNLKENWLYFVGLLLFFSIAEVFPRIGLIYLPDRAWLFVSLLACFFLPGLIKAAFEKISLKIVKIGTVLIIAVSLLITWGITYANGGWVNENEYLAAKWIGSNLPSDSIIISQPGNNIMLEYFAGRQMTSPPAAFFLTDNPEAATDYIDNLPDEINNKEKIDQKIADYQRQVASDSQAVSLNNQLISQIVKKLQIIKVLKESSLSTQTAQEIGQKPIYILYSNDKFSRYYASHQWWRDYNFYGANLDKFNSDHFEKVFDQGDVLIWKCIK